MGYRALDTADVEQVLLLHERGEGLRAITRVLQIDRKTVRRYVALARTGRLSLISVAEARALVAVVQRRARRVTEVQHALSWAIADIRRWIGGRLSLCAVRAKLLGRGISVSYSTLRRFAIDECGWATRPRRRAPPSA